MSCCPQIDTFEAKNYKKKAWNAAICRWSRMINCKIPKTALLCWKRENGYSAEEALAICKRHKGPIHLVLTDIVLPKLSGLELAARLESLYPGIKTLFMSGYTDHALLAQGILDPDKNFLQKPFTLDELVCKIQAVLPGLVPPPHQRRLKHA